MRLIAVLFGTQVFLNGFSVWCGDLDVQGPVFLQEPQHRLDFSNSSGGRLDCTAHGSPIPEIEWIQADGSSVTQIPDIRMLYSNGSMGFLPFSADRYRHDVHAATYRCRLRNPIGTVLSREVHIKAVIRQKYDIQVHDEYVIAGNTAVLKCKVPSYVTDYIMVTSWVQDGSVDIYPNTDIDGKYVVLSNGDLYINNAGPTDGYKNYACRTVHRLTGEVQVSTYPGRIIVTEARDGSTLAVHQQAPRVTVDRYSARRVVLGHDVTLPCVAQGYPLPTYQWRRELQGQTVPIALDERLQLLSTGLLKISKVRLEDRGVYLCYANNSRGAEIVRITLEIRAPLSAYLQPQAQLVDVGRQVRFQCIVGGYPVTQITWLHDGKLIVPDVRVAILVDPAQLNIRQLIKEDRGMYQCIASNNWDQIQAGAELSLGDARPELTYYFSEQTLQPGPALSLKCVASGNPPPQFTWQLDGFPIPQDSRFMAGQYVTVQDDVISHINITLLKSEDGGDYSCIAQNSVDKVSHTARINVFGLPFIRPMFRVTAIAGGRLSIKCPVAGYPIETVTWERAGQTLPINRRQRVYANGTLTIEQTQRTADAGTYTCQAQNRQKNTSRRDIEVQVTVPPKILPINPMTDLLREGMRAGITCQIMEGDLPISFRWGRNGQPVSNNVTHGTVLRRIDEFSSSLVIDPVTSAHSGNYTCVASNLAGEERYIVPLTVNVPPRWTVEPSDINVATGQEAMLNCQADGYPSPVITWKKAVGQQPGEYKDFLFERNVHQYQNGSLNIIDIFKDSEGHYLCEAKNNIGTGVSKVIFLKVNAPAHFTDKVKQVRVGRYEQAHIQCTALGDTPMEILWRIGAHYIGGAGSGHLAHEQRYSVREQILAEGMVSELTIGRTQREDTGALTCTATNLYGKDEMDIQLIVQEIPEMPKNVQVSDQLSRSIGVTWTQPFTGNSPITNYIVQYKEVQEMWPAQAQRVLVPGTQTIVSVDNLKPAQNYHLRILAENRMGLSEPSQVVQVGTLDEVPSGAPVQINLEPMSSTEIRVDWDSPLRDTWNGKLLGYHVGYKELSAGDVVDNNSGVGGTEQSHAPSIGTDPLSYTFKSVEVRPHYGGEAILQGLRKYYNYSIIVQAYNSRGSGPASDPLITRTNEDAPSLPPDHVLCDVQGAQSIQINWQSPLPEGRNGIISGYKVTYHSVGEWFDNDDQQTKIISQLRANILGLRKYTNYSISVLAFTGGGDGVKSDPTFCHTDEDVPSAPADIKAVLNGSNRILVTWLPPKHSNGVLIGYTFYMSTLVEGREEGTNKRTLAPNVDWYETLKVQNGATCQFWVTASTRIGEGDSSRVLSLTIPSSFASASSIPQLSPRIASFGREILTVWRRNISLPCRRVGGIGAPPPAALWEANDLPLETGGRRSVAANGTLFLRDVQHSDEGNYTCRIADDHGHDQITYRVRILVAPRAPILTVVDTYADSLHLRWLDQHNGGSPILGYVINYKREHGDWEELTIDSRTDEHMLRNLQCGTRYLLYITAYNKIGTGLPCDIVTTYTKGTVPISPNQSQMLTTNSTVVTAWLDSWGDGGCGILYFIIEYHLLSSADDGKWLMAANHIKPTERIISIRDLTPGTTYQLKVTAFNNAGESWAIYNFNTLTVSGGMPETITPTEEWTGYYVIFRIITPLLIVILLTAWISVGFLKKKKFFGGNCTTNTNAASATSQLSESPTLTQLQNKQNNDKKYLAVRTAAASCGSAALIPGIRAQRMQPSLPSAGIDLDSVGHRLNNAYKTETDYIEDICPYATFQLGNKVAYSESSYSGNIYSGPYHSVHGSFLYHDVKSVPSRHQEHTLQIPRTDDDDPSVLEKYQMHTKEHEYTKVRRKGGRLRDPHSGSQESDNWGSTDSEVKQILTLHLPISEYDTLGSDSESNAVRTNQEMISFTNKIRGGADRSTSSSEISPPTGSMGRKLYPRGKNKGKGAHLNKRHVRSSSGYPSYNQETTFSISQSINDHIHPPTS